MTDPNARPDAQRNTTDNVRTRDRIDVHAHFIPDFYRTALIAAGKQKPDGMPRIPDWNAEENITVMDELGIETAILSISSPGVHFGDDTKARALCRRVNEEGKRLTQRFPGRFGFFASVPLPDHESSVAEAIHALDTLEADGIVLETNHRGDYLGEPTLEPLYAELNRRNAVIFIHPTSPACTCCERLDERYPRPMLEFLFDTTRSISDMVLSGVLQRYPNLRVIVPHAGAALPVLAERMELFAAGLAKEGRSLPSMREAMRKLHFDIAGAPVPTLLSALLQVADPARIHYGSDYPFTPAAACEALLGKIEQTNLLDDAGLARIFRSNSLALFPRFAQMATK